jgi:hypothetical protein
MVDGLMESETCGGPEAFAVALALLIAEVAPIKSVAASSAHPANPTLMAISLPAGGLFRRVIPVLHRKSRRIPTCVRQSEAVLSGIVDVVSSISSPE